MGWVQRSELSVFQSLGIFQRDNELLLKISHNSKEKKESGLWPLDTIIISGVTTTMPWVPTECRVSHWRYFTRSHIDHIEKTKPLLWKAWSSLFAFVPDAKLRTSTEMWMNQVELRLECSALPRSCVGRAIAECSDSSLSNVKGPAMLSAGLCPLLFLSLGKRFSEKVRPWPCTPVCGMLHISLHILDCVALVLFRCNAVLFMCAVDQLGLLSLCFDLNKPGLAVSWVPVWHPDNISSMVLLGNAVMIMMLDHPLFSPIHTCLCHLLGMLLAPWPSMQKCSTVLWTVVISLTFFGLDTYQWHRSSAGSY